MQREVIRTTMDISNSIDIENLRCQSRKDKCLICSENSAGLRVIELNKIQQKIFGIKKTNVKILLLFIPICQKCSLIDIVAIMPKVAIHYNQNSIRILGASSDCEIKHALSVDKG